MSSEIFGWFGQLENVNIPKVPLAGYPVQNVVEFMLQLAAALSLVYVIIAAVRLTTSSGDPQSVATSRKTIIFAVVGLIISVMGLAITSIIQTEAARIAGASNPFFGEGGVITVLVEKLSFAIGVASVIMVIVGGLRFITSGGDPQTAKAARNTVLYAIIGMIVAISGVLLVSFVLSRIGGSQ
ncbi:MAG TPA: hypothetical protein VF996_03240 [Candidatus Saccharimonadales bacterium]|jgi:hypothetical protein